MHGALLDFNLRGGQNALPIAKKLRQQGCPFVFISGVTGAGTIPAEFRDVPLLAKPILDEHVRRTVRTFAAGAVDEP